MTLEIHAMIGDTLSRSGPPYTFGQLAQAMASPEMTVTAYTLANRMNAPIANVRVCESVDPLFFMRKLPLRVLRRLGSGRNVRQLLRAVRGIESGRCVWTFGNVPLALMRALNREGIPVVREKYNCAQRVARDLLTQEYERLGLHVELTITDESIALEEQSLLLADAIFAPSPLVAASLEQVGIPPERLLATSYGWEPARFPRSVERPLRAGARPTILFLGYACVRKGIHILLEAWQRAAVDGELLVVGNIEPGVAERYGSQLALPNVTHIPHTNDIEGLLRRADWMAFPTLEEGSPLVSYEALGNWLPMITTPMGAGALIRDGLEGLIVRNNDVGAWTETLQSLPDRLAERESLEAMARARSLNFTWSAVGARRRAQLIERFG